MKKYLALLVLTLCAASLSHGQLGGLSKFNPFGGKDKSKETEQSTSATQQSNSTSNQSSQVHESEQHSLPAAFIAAPAGPVAEAALLDVGINLFTFSTNTVLSASEEASLKAQSSTGEQVVYADKAPRAIREVESYSLPVMLRDELLAEGQFKSVSLRPGPTDAHDLVVDGEILKSTGNSLILRLTAVDATGTRWFSNNYSVHPDSAAYSAAPPDPYAAALKDFKNSLLNTAQAKGDEIKKIERMANMKYAASLAPEVFGEYLSTTYDGRTRLVGMPSSDDAFYAYAMRCLDEEKKIIAADFGRFYTESMGSAYQSYFAWRREYGASIENYEKFKREHEIALKKAKTEGRGRRIGEGLKEGATAWGISILSGRSKDDANKVAGAVVVAGLAETLANSFRVDEEGNFTFNMDEAIREEYPDLQESYEAAREKEAKANQQHGYMIEQSQAFESHATAINVELFDATVELEGSVDKQFATLREKLVEVYQREKGSIQTAAQ